ncbi:hypothetical protein MRB53_038173 [Persea americana]|nr:hypothetical protein MRB53_038173 [Persea americana]
MHTRLRGGVDQPKGRISCRILCRRVAIMPTMLTSDNGGGSVTLRHDHAVVSQAPCDRGRAGIHEWLILLACGNGGIATTLAADTRLCASIWLKPRSGERRPKGAGHLSLRVVVGSWVWMDVKRHENGREMRRRNVSQTEEGTEEEAAVSRCFIPARHAIKVLWAYGICRRWHCERGLP